MTEQTLLQQLEHCQDRYQALLKSARQDEWKTVEQGVQSCQQLLSTLERQSVSQEQAAQVRTLLQQIQQLHAELSALVQRQQEKSLKLLRKDSQGKKMRAAYGQAKRP